MITSEIQNDLYSYLSSVCKNHNSKCYKIGGTKDHVHIACDLPRTITISQFILELKSHSSKWMKTKCQPKFSWQNGYGVFSLGYSQLPILINYIDKQHQHHKKKSFKEELVEFYKKYSVEYNEEYLWN